MAKSWGFSVGLFRPRKKELEDTTDQVVGGFAFFLSLFFLLPTAVLFLGIALGQVQHGELSAAITFLASLCTGLAIAHYGIRGHFSVLIHEWKHEVVSSLVGNRNKRMEVSQHTGSLQYEYTKKTAHYNAFISLAPYILPVFTFIGILISVAVGPVHHLAPIVIIGMCFGIDLLMNARDISPIQTDISLIRGGYAMGLLYILSWNMLTTGIVLAWVFQGVSGISAQFEGILRIFISLYSAITGWSPNAGSAVSGPY